MKAINFNTGWQYRHLDCPDAPVAVTLPHDAMLAEARSEDAPSGVNGCWFEGYDYLYEKRFTPEQELAGKALVLEFEGVYRCAEVWINGQRAAMRPYGYTNFYVDMTDLVKIGEENAIEVIARNAEQPNSRWYSGAGIYRPVTLWVGEPAHVTPDGVRIRTMEIIRRQAEQVGELELVPRAVDAVIEVDVHTTAPGEVQVDVLDGETVVGTVRSATEGDVTLSLRLTDAKLWSPEAPNLYTCRVRMGEDEYRSSFGVRTLTWGREGLCINGKRVILKGACVHHDHGVLGACCYPDAEERRVRLLMENGYNALRSAHNPCSKALLEACDRLGMLVMDEYIDHWYIHKTEYDYVQHFDSWWRQDLSDMVAKDYNHPSVILYSTGNEVSETAQERGIALTKELTEFLHSLDSTRPVTCGVNIFFNFLSSIGMGVYSDAKAKKEAEKAEKRRAAGAAPKKTKAVGSKFFNDMAGLLGDEFMKRGATLPPCDLKTRDAFAAMDIAGYNYGVYRYHHDLKKYPDRLILGTETFCNDAYRFWEHAKLEPRLIGDFVWAGQDYLGECSVGSWEYREYAPKYSGCGWMTAGSGRIDLTGKPLGEALYTRVALEKERGPFICVRPVNHSGEKHSPSAWKMTNAMPSWSWRGCEGRKAHVEVYGRGAEAALYVNGRLVGRRKLGKGCVAHFETPYESGRVDAMIYDARGRELSRHALLTAGEETVLRAEAEKATTQVNRLCYVRLRYTDRKGETKPMERGKINVSVTGGKLLGLGSACPYYAESYLDTVTDTYYGEALAVLMADGSADSLTLTANDGEHTAEVVVPVEQ